MKFREFSKDWYQATVYVKGKKQTGYINKKDVAKTLNKLESGYAKRNIVNVYTSTSRKSKVIKKYRYGSILKYRYYSPNWYIATVYVKGKKRIGFIHASDTASTVKKLKGYALNNKVNVYSSASKNGKILRSYKKATYSGTYHITILGTK